MEHIPLYIDQAHVLNLTFLTAVHPARVPLKADHWRFVYQLFHNRLLLDAGLFSATYFICEQRKILILEEYAAAISNQESIQTDDDVTLNLRLFDFENYKTGKFSILTGGLYLPHRFAGSHFIFSKCYTDRTVEFEVDITRIPLVDITGVEMKG